LKTLSRNFFIALITIILIFYLLHKLIIKKSFEYVLGNIMEKEFIIETINIDIKKSTIKLNNIRIVNEKNFNYKNLLNCREVFINFNLKSIFTETLEINKLIIKNLDFYVEINNDEFTNNENNKKHLKDNLDEIIKSKKNYQPKIYPQKRKDKNFIIKNVELLNSKANLKFLNIYEYSDFKLSDMFFSNVGNSSSNSQHFKEIFKIFLIDMYLRIPNFEIRKKIKKIYKF
tara:strand:- start:1376 stop:2065 length:690 start_codon:yes stop_codon:yes gene_type:complete